MPRSRPIQSLPAPSRADSNPIIVWVYGANTGKRKTGFQAGWALHFLDPEFAHLDESARLSGPVQSGNRAEFTAMIRAIELCPKDRRRLLTRSANDYCVKSINRWIKEWRKNGWLTKSGEPVKNQDLIKGLEAARCSRRPRPKFKYFKSPDWEPGFMEVQAWAKAAAELPRTDGDDSESEVSDDETSDDETSDDRGHDEVHLAENGQE